MILQVGVKALVKRGNAYLFLLRSKAFKSGPQKWDIPGGRIEPDEQLYDALKREINEETGMELTSVAELLAAQDIFVPEKDLRVVRLTYIAEADGDVAVSDEHESYRWMSLKEVLDEPHVDSYLREVLEKI